MKPIFLRLTHKMINIQNIKTVTKREKSFEISMLSNGTNVIGMFGLIIGRSDPHIITVYKQDTEDYMRVSEFFDKD